jgi:hypothetical protein
MEYLVKTYCRKLSCCPPALVGGSPYGRGRSERGRTGAGMELTSGLSGGRLQLVGMTSYRNYDLTSSAG